MTTFEPLNNRFKSLIVYSSLGACVAVFWHFSLCNGGCEGLGKMGYWDNDGNWSSDSGSTSIKTGEFREQRDRSDPCPGQQHWRYTTLRYSDEELEYIKVTYEILEE